MFIPSFRKYKVAPVSLFLILLLVNGLVKVDGNGHGLLRSSINGVFHPVNITLAHSNSSGESDTADMKMKMTTHVEDLSLTPSQSSTNSESHSHILLDPDYDEMDTNKTKRSKAAIRWLKKVIGLSSGDGKPTGEMMERQMQDDSPDSADSDVEAVTQPSASILSRLNPINKISYKISAASNAVTRVAKKVGGVFGFSGNSAGGMEGQDAGGDAGEGQSDGESSGGTRNAEEDGAAAGTSGTSSSLVMIAVTVMMTQVILDTNARVF